MRTNRLTLLALTLVVACSSSETAKPTAVPAPASPQAAAPVVPLAARTIEEPAHWASPIADYIAVGEQSEHKAVFARGIHDLHAFGDRLHFAYGDGTYNLGELVPIEFRSFRSTEDPKVEVDFKSDEEQIDRFRLVGGELFQAGVDATDPDELSVRPLIVGNVYRLTEGWQKYRKVPGGEHVHDVAWFEGAVYAVGSGAANRSEWEGGKIFRYLWRSEARGDGFTVAHRMKNTEGDTRWVHLLPLRNELLVFGYEGKGEVNVIANAHLSSGKVEMLPDDHAFRKIAVNDVEPAPDFGGDPNVTAGGIVRGIDLAVEEAKRHDSAWHVTPEGRLIELSTYAGKTIADVSYVAETQEVLLLTVEGTAAAAAARALHEVTLYVAPAADPNAGTPVARFSTKAAPRAVAYFNGALFFGNNAGEVWRSRAPAPSAASSAGVSK